MSMDVMMCLFGYSIFWGDVTHVLKSEVLQVQDWLGGSTHKHTNMSPWLQSTNSKQRLNIELSETTTKKPTYFTVGLTYLGVVLPREL